MEQSLHLEIISPDHTIVSDRVTYVNLPGVNGELGILPGHIPLMAALDIGKLHYQQDSKNYYVFISAGFAEVSNNKVTVLTEAAEKASEIDVARAQAAKERAKARLLKAEEDIDMARAEAAMHRAIIRLNISSL
ncbi:F0F1 ATP synthase subunit epsilon [Lawsonia intracellularis]|uniref:ATP synthase epsilon chain n=1 Tax=Lawsonia intracellularis (strain PHE/MN1-00) TaxID=363253 RepID=ATPE_LAWIP|nr:F0F1 ATP synthase subunit epsilon [Lawsonia intracellularis]Q1MRB7.1 RecName: Full=ATP synthase epsilon chain; AltName: Full=ATP synthase F1 sector epsilon subunit; AltName: Full=F-ATPase epsilon subunit [Lawsonia intracellularis PHE/MN1-00]AGC49820.1 F0F1 ATP synthase subunit epsilon [Lawsonia intracellularis N343]KAA0205323.1 ATP synthase epsilon chain [Lawsonia intracellularis]MBZ3892144.1 F0F1 ATP synthase subunit epsilon [Lawsonia intracellularis]OMQ04585.1 ATP synthase epsilon chain [